jgi:hypothetical protein
MHPRTFMVAGTGAGILTLVLYDNLIHDCLWTGRQAGAIRALMTQGVLAAPAWALLSGNDPRTIFIGTAAVTLAVVVALEWIRRNIGEPVPGGSAGRGARRFWRAVRRMPRTRHHERG